MAMENIVFLVAICVIYVSAVTPNQTTCPAATPVANFNLPRAFGLGIWYDLARYPNEYQTPGKCSYHKGRRLKGNVIKIKMFEGLENSTVTGESSATLDSETGEVIFSISQGTPRKNSILRTKPLFMDYDKYAIMYSCELNENKKVDREYAWILTRSKQPTADVWEALDDFFARSDILDSSRLDWADFSSGTCKFGKRN